MLVKDSRTYKAQDIAQIAGLGYQTVLKLTRIGKFPIKPLPGLVKPYVWSKTEVDKFFNR